MELLDKLGINWKLLIAQLINFVILFAILSKFVFAPMSKFLRERADKIAKSLQDAKEIEERMRKTVEERERIVVSARSEAERIIGDATKAGTALHAEAEAKIKATTESMITSAKTEIAELRRAELTAARAEIADLVVAAAERVLGEEVSPKWEKKKVEELVATVSKGG